MECLRNYLLPHPFLSSSPQFLPRSRSGGVQRYNCSGQCHGGVLLYCMAKASDRLEERMVSIATRRQILQLASLVVAGAAVIAPSNYALAEVEKVKFFSNIEDARVAGEKLREIKDAADGPIRTSSSGIKFRELEHGVGEPIRPGDLVSVYYTISRLNGYYLDSMGYGKEGKNDVGETLNFQYGGGMVPEAVEGGMEGMQVGAKRRILVTPERGWVRPDLLPQPTSFFAERRLSQRTATQALLMEVELVKAKHGNQ